jgi:hypothetical protein
MQTDDHDTYHHSAIEWLITLGGSGIALAVLGFIANQAPNLLIALTH